MAQRNRLVAALKPTISDQDVKKAPAAHGKARIGLATLPKMNPSSWCDRCFQRDYCFTLHRALEGGNGGTSELGDLFDRATEHMTKQHEDVLRHWIKLVDIESGESLHKRATPWLPVELVNQRDGLAIDGLTLLREVTEEVSNGDGKKYYVFSAPPTADGISRRVVLHDRVVLSVDGGMTAISRAQIMGVTHDINGGVQTEILLSTDRALRLINPREQREPRAGSIVLSAVWRIDKDAASLTMAAKARGNLIRLFTASPEAETIRQRIIDLKRPVFDSLKAEQKAIVDKALDSLPFPLNTEQVAAVHKIVSAEDYALILGLPGAGKTATLVAAVVALRAQGKSVLITSHTHSAIDNILMRLPDVGVTNFLRIGEEHKVANAVRPHSLGSEKWHFSVTDDLHRICDNAPVVGATCYAMGSAFFSRKHYDVVLVDEAGQITFPTIIPPLFMADKFVLVGDHHQLPPLCVSKDANEGGLSKSLFATLCDAHPDTVSDLSLQYRMAEPLTRLPNALTYSGRLRAGTEDIAKQMLQLDKLPPSGVLCDAPQWLAHVMDPAHHVVFLDTSGLGAAGREIQFPLTNSAEIDIVLAIMGAFVSRGVAPENMCVLSQFNAQVDAMGTRLSESRSLNAIEALTIDRSQGRDMEAVCVSFVRSNEQRNAGELLNDKRRLNVALTRAKKKLILIGCVDTLQSSPALADALAVLKREGWIVPLAKDSLEFVRRALANY